MSSAFDSPMTASIKSLFAFCSNKCCSLVHYLRKSLEFPINLLNSFCSTCLQGATHLPSKLSYSKSRERFQTEALNYTTVEDEPILTLQSEECVYSIYHDKCMFRYKPSRLLKREHFQAVQFLSQVKWSAATGTQRSQGPHFNTCIIFFCICSKSESYVFVDTGVLQCSALKNVTTVGRNGRSKFYKILSFSVVTGLGFWQVVFLRSWFQCNTAKAEK